MNSFLEMVLLYNNMNIGELIDELVLINVRIWHKDGGRRNKDLCLSDLELGELTINTKTMNGVRNNLRRDINVMFNEDCDDYKVNSLGEKC